MESLLALQPESYRQIIKRSIVLYRASFSKIILFSCLLSIMIFTPRFITILTGHNYFFNMPLLSFARLWIAIIDFVSLTLFIAILWHMHCIVYQIMEPLVEDITVGLRKVVLLFIAMLIQGVIFLMALSLVFGLHLILSQFQAWLIGNMLGMFLIAVLIIGECFVLIYVSSLFLFLAPIIATENKGILIAIKRSVLLVWNHWWRVISVQFTPWIGYLLLLMVIKYVFHINIHLYLISPTETTFGISFMQLILFALLIPWVAALFIIQLRDLELRNKMFV
jgi:hypothetical protein